MIMSVRVCLSIDLLNVILLPSKFVYFHEICIVIVIMHFSSQKCNVTCGRNVIYHMTLSLDLFSPLL